MKTILIKNAKIVNEGSIFEGDVLIEGEYIKEIAPRISHKSSDCKVIDAEGNYLIPGAIDDQVHFREPGLTHKGTIASESRAMMGGTNNNLEEILKTNPRNVAGLKLFLGSSTGDMLVDSSAALESIFSSTKLLIAVHSEDENTVKNNLENYKAKYGDDIPVVFHPEIRSVEACYICTEKIIKLAKKTGARLHVFHLSTAKELDLFTNKIPLEEKQITAEVCIHHLWFSDEDYATKGNLIKWNPAVKSAKDREALWKALLNDTIDVIATDHAPHTLEEKQQVYTKAPSGGPLVQHAVVAMFEAFHQGKISVEKIVEKMAHNPAKIFKIEKRGFIKEGYYADLAIVNSTNPWSVNKDNILYKCGWSPFEGTNFKSRISHTFVNGQLVYENATVKDIKAGKRLLFDR